MNSFDAQLRFAKVEYETKLATRCIEIIQSLSDMGIGNRVDGFECDNNRIILCQRRPFG